LAKLKKRVVVKVPDTNKTQVVVIKTKEHHKKIGVLIYKLENTSAIYVEDEPIIYEYNDYIQVIGTL